MEVHLERNQKLQSQIEIIITDSDSDDGCGADVTNLEK